MFLHIGAVAFGGLGATVALIERELVARRKVATPEEITEALTYTKLLPGSTVVQVVAYLGWRLAGWRGSAFATTAFLLPSAAMMLLLALGYAEVATSPGIAAASRGVLAAVAGLLLVTMVRLGRPLATSALPVALAAAAFLAVLFLKVSAVWAVVGAGASSPSAAGRRRCLWWNGSPCRTRAGSRLRPSVRPSPSAT